MAKTTANTIVGVFQTPQDARRAVMELRAAGFTDSQIGVVSQSRDGDIVSEDADDDTAENAGIGAAAGAAAGAGAGALWGLGILAGILPGIGPAIAGGTLGILLSSAAAGAAALGIAGTLVGLGIPENEAAYYEEEFKAGRTIVTVNAGAKGGTAKQVIERHGGYSKPQTAGV